MRPGLNLRHLILLVAVSLSMPCGSRPTCRELKSVSKETVEPNTGSFRLVVSLASRGGIKVIHGNGLRVLGGIPGLDAVVVAGEGDPQATLTRLRADAQIRSASTDLSFEVAGGCCAQESSEVAPGTFAAAEAALQTSFGALRALGTGSSTTVVAVLDTGIDPHHPDLAQAHLPGRSFLSGAPWNQDPSGHGTAMASLVAARPAVGRDGVRGVAPGVAILPVRVADRRGRALLSNVASGIVYAVDRGAAVVLLSMGARQPAPLLDEALRYAEERGVVVVAAAGNTNTNVDLFPAADERVLSVACVNHEGELAYSTVLAPTTDLVAPGVEALAALPRGRYAHVTGSSVAAARIAGVAALVCDRLPDANPAQVRAVLLGARRPLALFADAPQLARSFPAGPLDCARLAAQLRAPSARLALEAVRVLPTRARPGEPVVCLARLVNGGARPSPQQTVAVRLGGAQVATLRAPALAPGASVLLRARATMPETSGAQAKVSFAVAGGPEVACQVGRCARGAARDLGFFRVVGRPTADGGLQITARVEGRGQQAEGGRVALRLGEQTLSSAAFQPLGAGDSAPVRFTLSRAQIARLPGGMRGLQVRFVDREPDDAPGNDAAWIDVELKGTNAKLRTQYQQSGKLNVVLDTPWRLAPGRAYLPVLIYVPEKGDQDSNTFARLDQVTIRTKLAASNAASGQVIFQDVHGGKTTAPVGTVVTDEMGNVTRSATGQPDARVFGHHDLWVPGHYTILRLPREAFGVLPVPARDEQRFVEITVNWTNRRRFLGVFRKTRTGTTRKVLRVRFAAAARPRLPGEGHYYDAHVHTVAEWYQDDSFDLFAPRKAWGGPIPMIKESAHALGLTDAVDAVNGRVITTDHNAFYRSQSPVDDTLTHRPPYGPTGVAASGGKSEWDRMGEIFGLTRGEEVSFASSNKVAPLLNLPTGAHMLTYRAQHIDGPWHGGSGFARTLGDNHPNVELADVLRTVAKSNPKANTYAAIYAAHPFDGYNDWTEAHLETVFERDPKQRDDRSVLASNKGFAGKGLQLWNGDFGRHLLPTGRVDWNDLNPWANPTFERGNPDWDKHLNTSLGKWHRDLSRLLQYELKAAPGKRFPRKMFVTAGTDAHGDFNLTEDRLGTIISAQSTYTVDGNAFGGVLTYTLGELQEAGNPRERAFEAMLDGNSVLTDGPLVRFSLDAEDRFDGERLQWHAGTRAHEDADGRIGGGGDFDGRGTALVARGSSNARLGYRYTSTDEWGQVQTLEIYRTSVGDPNPVGNKQSGSARLMPRGSLAPAGPDSDLSEPLDPAQEGTIQRISLLQVGAYTGDPDTMDASGRRCLTNPVWCVPFDATVAVSETAVDAQGVAVVPSGALTVRFKFDMSMRPDAYRVELKALDANGTSTDVNVGPIDVLVPVGGNNGWSADGSMQDAVLTLTNQRAIPLNLDRFPSASDVTFVVYFYDAPRGPHGNQLNKIAHTFTLLGSGSGGGTGPALPRASAAPGATGPQAATAGGRRSGGGGCSLRAAPTTGGAGILPALLLLAGLILVRVHSQSQTEVHSELL